MDSTGLRASYSALLGSVSDVELFFAWSCFQAHAKADRMQARAKRAAHQVEGMAQDVAVMRLQKEALEQQVGGYTFSVKLAADADSNTVSKY